jgi:hypothetical protein
MSKIPLNELPSELPEQGGIAWQFPIHAAACNTSALFLSERQLRVAARLAGFGGVVISSYQGGLSTYEAVPHDIGSAYGDGSVAATGSVAETRVETEKVDLIEGDDNSPCSNYNWPIANISINKAELAARITTKHRGLSREDAWARELSRSIRRGMTQAAGSNLIEADRGMVLFGFLFAATAGIGIIQRDVEGLVGSTSMVHAFVFALEAIANKDRDGFALDRKRWSLMPGEFQPDRFALAAMAAYAKPMVTVHR